MATANPFDLLGDDDNDDPSQLIAAHEMMAAAKKSTAAAAPPAPAAAKFPSKPPPPAQAVREARGGGGVVARGGGGGRGGGYRGRGGRGGGYGANRDMGNGNIDGFSGGYGGGGGGGGGGWGEEGERFRSGDRERGGYGGYRGGRRGGYGNVEGGEEDRPPRRTYERRSGTGRGYEVKREGAGRGNWGTMDDAIAQVSEEAAVIKEEDKGLAADKENDLEKSPEGVQEKEGAEAENEEKEKEEKEMTLEEYEKIKEEKRKALLASKPEERKVDVDKELRSMQQLSVKKGKDDIFIKLGSEKESKKQKDNFERSESSKKSLSINEFLKPSEGGFYTPAGRGRGRGRGRGERGAGRGDFGRGGYSVSAPTAPELSIPIADPGQFPALGGK